MSDIDITIPRAGHADTSRVRAQFVTIKGELEAINQRIDDLISALDAGVAIPDDVVRTGQLKDVAYTGHWNSLEGLPTIPSTAALVGALPIGGGLMQGPITLSANGEEPLQPVAVRQLTAVTDGLGSAAAMAEEDFATAAQGLLAETAVQPAALAPVATSGAYSDLSGVPTFGSAAATDASAYATAAQGSLASSAVQPAALAPVATSGALADLSGELSEAQLDAPTRAKLNDTLPYKIDGTRAPVATDDEGAGWAQGSLWVDQVAEEAYRCVSAAAGAAVWVNTTLSTSDLAVVAMSGNYADLSGKPTVLSAFTNDAGFIAGAESPVVSVNGKSGNVTITYTDVGAAAAAHTHANATTTVAGLMSGADKIKLNSVATGADVSPVTSVNSQTGVVTLTYSHVGAASAGHAHGEYALTSHNHDGAYLGIGAKAADSDKLDGMQPSAAASNNTIVQRHSAGYIYANYFNTTPNDVSSGVTKICCETGDDGFIRHATAAAVASFISGQTFTASYASNADKLDGISSESFLRSDANDTHTGNLTINGTLSVRTAIDLADNDILQLGSGDDWELFCNGTHAYMDLNAGIGNFYIRDGTTTRFTFDDAGHFSATGNITAYYSDERLKDLQGNIQNALDAVCRLDGFRYVNNSLAQSFGYTDAASQLGLSAQQVQALFPEVVSLAPFDRNETEDGEIVSKSGEHYLTLDYAKLVPVLVEAIKELRAEATG